MPLGIKLPNRDAEPGSTTGEQAYSTSIILCPLHAGALASVGSVARRLDRLRQVVPHAERANTASFLEECITYIQNLQKRIAELEQLAGLTQATVSHPALTGLPGHLNMPVPAQISFPGAAQQPGATAMGRAINSQGPLDPPDARDPQASAGTPRSGTLFCHRRPLSSQASFFCSSHAPQA